MIYFSNQVLVVTLTIVWVQHSASQCLTEGDAMLRINEKARKQLLQSQLTFSTDLLQAVGEMKTSENVFFSPSSVFSALLLAYFVSANQTEDSLKKTLKLDDQVGSAHSVHFISSKIKYRAKIFRINALRGF